MEWFFFVASSSLFDFFFSIESLSLSLNVRNNSNCNLLIDLLYTTRKIHYLLNAIFIERN